MEKFDFESSIENLQQIALEMEQNEISLERSIELYKLSAEIAEKAFSALNQAEKEVLIAKEGIMGQIELAKFEGD